MNGIDKVKEAIITKDKALVINALSDLSKEVVDDDEVMAILTSPACITELHEMLVEHLGVNQRLMRLRAKIPHRRKRALLFVQAMINGVNYLQ